MLVAQPGVAAAAAAVATDDIGHRVVAVVVAEPGVRLSTADVLRGAGAELANYMLPRSIAVVPALPLTVNGKLDRAAVLGAAGTAAAAQPAGTAIVEPAVAVLVELFRHVLDNPALPADADFFDAGGDSMRAIRLVALARDRGLLLSVREVYAASRAGDLAALARAAPAEQSTTGVAPFALLPGAAPDGLPADVIDAYPVTAMQLGMLYHQETAPDARVYHIVLSYRVRGRLDLAALRAAAQAVVDAHPVLRTSLDLASPWGPVRTGARPPGGAAARRGPAWAGSGRPGRPDRAVVRDETGATSTSAGRPVPAGGAGDLRRGLPAGVQSQPRDPRRLVGSTSSSRT